MILTKDRLCLQLDKKSPEHVSTTVILKRRNMRIVSVHLENIIIATYMYYAWFDGYKYLPLNFTLNYSAF